MNSTSLRVVTPAKVNLILRVLDRRPDGFHAIWSLMHTVGLTDEITLAMRPAAASQIALRCDHAALAVDRSNLVYRAAQLVLERVDRPIDLSITLTKRIPLGAGLGGGSSDAAATILGLVRLLGLGWSVQQMAEVGQQLGSDVPFFFVAPAACVTGRGEVVRPVQVTGQRWIVLVNPGFPVETKWAYQQLAATRQGVRPLSDSLQQLGNRSTLDWAEIIPLVENDFEVPVFAQHPVLGQMKRQLVSLGAEVALLSGSGATMFGVFQSETAAKQAAMVCAADPQRKVYVVPAGRAPEATVLS
ncbi:MAG: 4-(cytidine 5'-diphospho)-2-C-methyl-D-erythritol kinase [Nitrospira sp.]|nr:4-(cytidine 5'-diphospho)-2-C-methyl-D-erythritol kinase [Nitrospira sp.]